MTETTTERTDLGNGWTRHGQHALWASEPREAFIGHPVRDLLCLSTWRIKGQEEPVLRIETGDADQDDDLANLDCLFDGWNGHSVELPLSALPELAYLLTRILGIEAIYAVVERINSEREEHLKRLLEAAGGNPDATLGEAEAALKAQEG